MLVELHLAPSGTEGAESWLSINSRRSSRVKLLGSVVSMNSDRISAKRKGSSTWGKCPDSFEDLEAAFWNCIVCRKPMSDGDNVVPVTPNDQCRNAGGEIQAIHCTYRLPTRIDDTAQRADEGLLVLRLAQRHAYARHISTAHGCRNPVLWRN